MKKNKILATILISAIGITTLSSCSSNSESETNDNSDSNYSQEDGYKSDQVLTDEDEVNETIMSLYTLTGTEFPEENIQKFINDNRVTEENGTQVDYLKENSDFNLDDYFFFDDFSEEEIYQSYLYVIGMRSLFPTQGSVEKITIGEDNTATVTVKEELRYPDEYIEAQKESQTDNPEEIQAVLSTEINYVELKLKKIDGKWKIDPETYFGRFLSTE